MPNNILKTSQNPQSSGRQEMYTRHSNVLEDTEIQAHNNETPSRVLRRGSPHNFDSQGLQEYYTRPSYAVEDTGVRAGNDMRSSHALQRGSPFNPDGQEQKPSPSAVNSRSAVANTSSNTGKSFFKKVDTACPNIVIFGSTGTGKSSVINMLAGEDVATTSNKAVGCTFGSAPYPVTIDGAHFNFWDTAGLNEGDEGSVPAEKAWENLRELVQGLQEGVSLLVYCIRAARYRDIIKVNYDLFVKIICQSTVPVVVVITGLENEENMEDWWTENERQFTMRGLEFAGHACITSSKGKMSKDGSYLFEEEFEESKIVLRKLISEKRPRFAWTIDSQVWLSRITDAMNTYYEDFNQRVETDPAYYGSLPPSSTKPQERRERRVIEPDPAPTANVLSTLIFSFLRYLRRNN